MEQNFHINSNCHITLRHIGIEQQPIMIVDNLLDDANELISYAEIGTPFQRNSNDFYPGIRKSISTKYSENIVSFLNKKLYKNFNQDEAKKINIITSALSLTTTQPRDLRPIQSVPHTDSCDANNIAMVHYLCSPDHGGTCFYRHRKTGYESVDAQQLKYYAPILKEQVIAEQKQEFNYVTGDNNLFECTEKIDAVFNRAIFYRSNILHSGNIQSIQKLSSNPRTGRLTANMLLAFC